MSEVQSKPVPILSRLSPPRGAVRSRMRVGRGTGSGKGKTCGQGQKGQKARGTMKKLHFQGGQIPLQRALPKVGFKNAFRVSYAPVNLNELAIFPAGRTVDEALLRGAQIVKGHWDGVKVLAGGRLDHPMVLRVHAISAAARAKVESVGGTVELVSRRTA